ncbi:MAG: SpoIIE family protein phosphatase [Bacteroidales bacterium]|nr:SpoIIE family protein phosphatase [Bacteroidales bacterium]
MNNLPQEIIENIGEGICVINFNEEFIYTNPALCNIFDVPNEKLTGRCIKDFIDDFEWKKILDQTKIRKTGKKSTYDIVITTEKRKKKVLLFTGTPNYNQNGAVINTIGIFRDISVRAAEKVKIKEANKQNEELHQQLFTQTIQADIQKKKVEDYSKQLNDGINFAKTVQTSLLPNVSCLKEGLSEDIFILYKPKQTIGGDFYYYKKRNDFIVFAVADCTGHGVSGALISMLGIAFLDDIIEKSRLLDSGEILRELREKVKKAFIAYGDDVQNKNGMDISFCIINKKTDSVQFSGAYNPLYIIRNNELKEYKGTKNPIAFYPVEKEFETHQIQLQKGDNIYLFSDGFQDQLGGVGESKKKYSRKRFKEFLLKIHKFDFVKQEQVLEKELKNWAGDYEQIDDVTIMGLKWQM